MKYLLAVAAALLLAACVPAPVRPPQPVHKPQNVQASIERERLARELAELKRMEVDARAPVAGRISSWPSIATQALDPTPAKPVEEKPAPMAEAKAMPQPAARPARVDPAMFAWQLSDDLRKLHSHPDVQTFYSERGWVVSVPADALFEPGETDIKAGDQETLDSLARVLRHYATRGIVMDGPQIERAQAIRRALAERGIPQQAIIANGVGERVEFLVPHSHLNAGAGR